MIENVLVAINADFSSHILRIFLKASRFFPRSGNVHLYSCAILHVASLYLALGGGEQSLLSHVNSFGPPSGVYLPFASHLVWSRPS